MANQLIDKRSTALCQKQKSCLAIWITHRAHPKLTIPGMIIRMNNWGRFGQTFS
jgi:hypothetical protein